MPAFELHFSDETSLLAMLHSLSEGPVTINTSHTTGISEGAHLRLDMVLPGRPIIDPQGTVLKVEEGRSVQVGCTDSDERLWSFRRRISPTEDKLTTLPRRDPDVTPPEVTRQITGRPIRCNALYSNRSTLLRDVRLLATGRFFVHLAEDGMARDQPVTLSVHGSFSQMTGDRREIRAAVESAVPGQGMLVYLDPRQAAVDALEQLTRSTAFQREMESETDTAEPRFELSQDVNTLRR